jgi:hypothetical protein
MRRIESVSEANMKTQPAASEYVGALSSERRLTLVRIDPSHPWDAFRRMRRIMRRQADADVQISLYESDHAVESQARVIDLDSRRRAG